MFEDFTPNPEAPREEGGCSKRGRAGTLQRASTSQPRRREVWVAAPWELAGRFSRERGIPPALTLEVETPPEPHSFIPTSALLNRD